MEEFEIKFLEVNVPVLEKLLVSIGAQKVGSYDYSRVLLDYPNHSMKAEHCWVRLRTDGKETTLTYKQRIGAKEGKDGSDLGMKEIEVVVSDYDMTLELIKAIGLVVIREEKNKRLRYEKGDVVFDIDSWPFIPTYIEIESSSLEKAKAAAAELGFNPEEGIIGTAGMIYRKYGIDKDKYSHITFEGMVEK